MIGTDACYAGNPTSMGRPTWARRPKAAQRLTLRASILLGGAEGPENRQVARQLCVAD